MVLNREDEMTPNKEVLLADSVGLALLVVLKMLAPLERLAFVLHGMLSVPCWRCSIRMSCYDPITFLAD